MKKRNTIIVVILSVLFLASVIAALSFFINKKLELKNPDFYPSKNEVLKPDNNQKSAAVNSKIIYDNRNKKKSAYSDTETIIRLNINTLTASGIENNEAVDITKIIYSRILSSKGKDAVIYRSVDGSSKKANRILSGRINKLEGTIVVSVKVTDVERGKVVFNYTERINQSDSIKIVLESLADKIIADGEVWNQM